MLRRLLLFLLAVVVIGTALYALRSRMIREYCINPQAKIDPKQDYTLKVWIGKPVLPNTAGSYVSDIEDLVATYTSNYTNITVETYFIPQLQLEAKLAEAIKGGDPPDIYFNPISSQVFFGELQVPFGLYVSKEQAASWLPPAMAQASANGKIYGYPTAFYSRVFMANPARLTIERVTSEQLATMGWTWEQFYTAVEKSNQPGKPGLVLTNYGDPVLRAIAASTGKPAPFDDSGRLLWSESDIANIAEIWHRLSSIQGLPALNVVNEDCLIQFIQGKAALIGPLNPQLTVWLWNEAHRKGLDPVLLPVPSATEDQFTDLSATSVLVFRQVSYQGHSHTKAAAELARHLGEGLGPILSKHLAAIPYGESYLPFGAPTGQAYSDILRAAVAPYSYGPAPGVANNHWAEVINPLWLGYVTGKKTAGEFTSQLYTSLHNLAYAQP
ncbi:MAG: carbohydrate ABC transporter substrate-binding protein [Peptococcaceae bacterium]|nr:carbohydrate ABC transporter substrate-binding protein [Peptococcaceae bacterium]